MAISRGRGRRPSSIVVKKQTGKGYSAGRLKAFRGKYAARTAARVQTAMREILAVYQPDWPFVPVDPRTKRRTRSGIALWLLRSGLVTAFAHEGDILKVLEKLVRQRKIKLPQKTTSGGAHKKKK